MRIHKYITSQAQLASRGKELLRSTENYKHAFKVTLVVLIASDPTEITKLSKLTGIPIRTLSYWVQKADAEGFESLVNQHSPGRPGFLSESEKAKIKDAISANPTNYGYDAWTGKNLADFIQRSFKIDIGIRQCQKMLKANKNAGSFTS